MATFTWRERLRVWVGECNRASAVQVAREVNTLLKLGGNDEITLAETLGELLVLNSPYKISLDGQPLNPDENHLFALNGEEQPITLALPLTSERFKALPASLARAWVDAAESENRWLHDDLFFALRQAMQTNSEPASDSALSSE